MATTTAAKAPRKARTPSAFHPTTRVTVSVHADVDSNIANTTALSEIFTDAFSESGYSIRLVSRVRKARKSRKTGLVGTASGPSSLMVYLAPEGFKFATTAERGVRLDADTAKLLRMVAEKMGLDPNDPASLGAVAVALAQRLLRN